MAVIYAALGNINQAMNWLETGYAERFNPGVLLRPGLDPPRSDPQFQGLEHRVGLNHSRANNWTILTVNDDLALHAFMP